MKAVYDFCNTEEFSASWTGGWAGTGVFANSTQCLKICQATTGCFAYRVSDNGGCWTSTTIGSAMVATANQGIGMLR